MKRKIYFLEVIEEDRDLIYKRFPKSEIISKTLSEDEIIKRCKEAEILCVFMHSKISKEAINSPENLKLIIARSVGYDHTDLQTAQEKGVIVCDVPIMAHA